MEKQTNIPTLRFPEFKGEWEKKKLGEVAEFKVTNSFSRENLNYENGDVKNIHYGDIHTKFQTLFDIENEVVPFVNEEMNVQRIVEDFYCKEGDLIFADASEDLNDVGKSIEIINLNNEKLLSGLHTLLARPNKKVFSKGFNGYLFKSKNVRLQIQKEAQGSKVLSINVGRISTVKISFPTLPEQTRIAEFFTAIDAKIQALKTKKQLLQQYKKGVMQQLFSQELRFKDENGKEFSKWEKKKFDSIFKRVSTKNIEDNQNVLTISAQHGLINQQDYFNKSVSANDVTGYYLIKKGDFAYNKSYSKGYPMGAIKCLTKYEKGVVSTLYICFNIKDKSNEDFYEHYFESGMLNKQIHKIAQEGARNHGLLNMSVVEFFKDIDVFKPVIQEQTKIANFLSSLDEKINHTETQIQATQRWKKGLLQQMFI